MSINYPPRVPQEVSILDADRPTSPPFATRATAISHHLAMTFTLVRGPNRTDRVLSEDSVHTQWQCVLGAWPGCGWSVE